MIIDVDVVVVGPAQRIASSTAALIRPDAYIAWAESNVNGQGATDIAEVLARWCGRPSRPVAQESGR